MAVTPEGGHVLFSPELNHDSAARQLHPAR